MGLLAVALLLGQSIAQAQRNHLSLGLGRLQYDAGLDRQYTIFRASLERDVGSVWRFGIGAGRSHIGRVRRSHLLPESDETLVRGYVSGSLVLRNQLRNTDIPLLKSLELAVGMNLGIVHSSGVHPDTSFTNLPFVVFKDDPTGLAGGVRLDATVRIWKGVGFQAEVQYWRDQLWGETLDDPEGSIGLLVSW